MRFLSIRNVAVLAVIGFFVWLFFAPTVDPAFVRKQQAQNDTRFLSVGLYVYRDTCGAFPKAADGSGIAAMMGGENPRKIMFVEFPKERVSTAGFYLDPWKQPYVFRIAGDKIVVISAGPDKKLDTKDDLSSDK